MRKYYIFILSMLILLIFQSCTDIIKLDLKDVEPQTIIEATLDVRDSTCRVVLTKSNSFYDTNEIVNESNLKILLLKNNQEKYEFAKQGDGSYLAEGVEASRADVFKLVVTEADGSVYTALATTPSGVVQTEIMPGLSLPFFVLFSKLDGFDFTETDSLGNEIPLLVGVATWQDNPQYDNFYRFKIYEKDEYINDFYSFIDDKSNFGDTIQRGFNHPFKENDSVTIELLSINEETYNYFRELREVLVAGMNSTTPFNPRGNFDNDALGYFCIQQRYVQKYKVTDFGFDPSDFR